MKGSRALLTQNRYLAPRSYFVPTLSRGTRFQRAALINEPNAMPSRQRGFTLLELTVVLLVVVLGFSVIGLNLSSGNDSTKIKSAARDIVSALRYARGQALMTRKETTVAISLSSNSYKVTGRDKEYTIPEAIDLTVVTAQTELTDEGTANVRFFPDGSSTGGKVKLGLGNIEWKININWLTGQIELENE